MLVIAIGALYAAQVAQAHYEGESRTPGYSPTPTSEEPFAACGRSTPGTVHCLSIVIPQKVAKAQAGSLATIVKPAFEGSGVGGGYSPADLESAYALPVGSLGAGQTVAIVDAFDDPNAESDLARYRSRYGLPPCTSATGCFKKVDQTGGTSYPSADPGWAAEISLDLDMVSAACPRCSILLVEATNNQTGALLAAEREAVALGATEISNSWAESESSGESLLDESFEHPGIPITAASGDEGFRAEWPAASGAVIAVGGTVLHRAGNSRGWTESAWSGSGSGCSAFEAKPAWQFDTGCPNRVTSDVAAVASPETPVSVADSFPLPANRAPVEPGWLDLGGTSAAAPLIAGIMALSGPVARSAGAEAFYLNPSLTNDIAVGNNGSCNPTYLCTAGPGYDGPTGVGTPKAPPVEIPGVGSTPAAVRDSATGRQWVYFQKGNGTIVGSFWNGSSWNPAVPLATNSAGGTSPQVIRDQSTGQQWLYYQGSDGAIWGMSTTNEGVWDSPSRIGGAVAPSSSPTVVRDPSSSQQWLYYQGTEGAIWRIVLTGSHWNSPERIGGSGSSQASPAGSPVAIRDASTGSQWLYYRGADSAIWGMATTSIGTWSAPERIGGSAIMSTTPTVLRDSSSGQQWIYYLGPDGTLWGMFWTGTRWNSPEHIVGPGGLGGPAGSPSSSPIATRDPSTGKQWIYYESREGSLIRTEWTGSFFKTRNAIGGVMSPGESAAVIRDSSNGNQWIYWLSRAKALFGQFSSTGEQWGGPELIG